MMSDAFAGDNSKQTCITAPVVLAPFANERMREWPAENFTRFVSLGLEDGYDFVVNGTLAQRALANEIVRAFPASRVENRCGLTSWTEAHQQILAAPFVVANNSGIAHVAATAGKWLLCVFSGSHSWVEWMPRGPRVLTLTNMPVCSPCISPTCFNDLACLSAITPELAYASIRDAMSSDLANR
jgi:ADP-heptose:LPS heptosyltransferase